MSHPVSITELLTAIGSDNINFQPLAACMENIKAKKGCTSITFVTDAITPTDTVMNTGPNGLILWVDRDLMRHHMEQLKAGGGQTMERVVQQRDELLSALETAREMVGEWGDYASDYFKEKHNLVGDLSEIDAAIAKAKGGAA